MSPAALTLGVMSRLTPTLRYWNEVAGEKRRCRRSAVAWKVVTGTGTSVPILSVVFLPSAARSRGAARMRGVAVGLEELANDAWRAR